jgi:hypothetical protein
MPLLELCHVYIYILYDLTCLIWLKNSTHSLSYMAYRCITVLINKTPYLSSVFTTGVEGLEWFYLMNSLI